MLNLSHFNLPLPLGEYAPGRDDDTIAFEEKFGAHHYNRLSVVVREALGCWITDINGNRYLDGLAAYSAANPGHHHPKIVDALVKALQGHYASVISNVVYTNPLGQFLKKTAELVPALAPRFGEGPNKVLPKNGGVESVETAIKMARFYGWKVKGIPDGRQEIIVFDNNFHGRMITVVSFSSTDKYRQGFGPLTPGFVSVAYGNLEAVEKAVNTNTCGILVEPMQGCPRRHLRRRQEGKSRDRRGGHQQQRGICDNVSHPGIRLRQHQRDAAKGCDGGQLPKGMKERPAETDAFGRLEKRRERHDRSPFFA